MKPISPLRGEWQARALCAGTDTNAWLQKDPDPRLKAWCFRCPVQRECLTETLELERGGVVIDMPVFRRVWYHRDNQHAQACSSSRCKGCLRVKRVTYEHKEFSVSMTPAHGIYGGFGPRERHTRAVKHLDGCTRQRCNGCRPVSERVELLLGPETKEEAS